MAAFDPTTFDSGAFDAIAVAHAMFPLAGVAQSRPLTAKRTYPLQSVRQTYPLGGA